MTEREGLALRDAVKWCGDGVSVREASRLRLLVATGDAQAAVTLSERDPNPELNGTRAEEAVARHEPGVTR